MEKTKNRFKLHILTPYLTELMEKQNDVGEQTNYFGYEPNNLNGVKNLETRENVISIQSPECIEFKGGLGRTINEGIGKEDLVIAGSTRAGEEEVENLKGSGLVIARYSIFYGGSNDYTGRAPEQTGYALDIPKSVKTVKALLDNDEVLNALSERKGDRIRDAFERLNATLERPILVTSYLNEALRH